MGGGWGSTEFFRTCFCVSAVFHCWEEILTLPVGSKAGFLHPPPRLPSLVCLGFVLIDPPFSTGGAPSPTGGTPSPTDGTQLLRLELSSSTGGAPASTGEDSHLGLMLQFIPLGF